MANEVADIANQALDAAGIDFSLGDIEEGSRPAQVTLRAYGQCLRQLLRAAHWGCARKQAPLLLLADATGNTPNVGTVSERPWTYEYAYPNDCMKARYVPQNYCPPNEDTGPPGNISLPPTPLTTGGLQPVVPARMMPARFLVSTDTNYAPPAGTQWWLVQGVSPAGRTVILTNVKGAWLVYTYLNLYPNMWDAQFRAALVAYLASEIALPLAKDKKLGLTLRAQNIAIAKEKINAARVSDGNEAWANTDHTPDFVAIRRGNRGGYGWGEWGGGPGYLWGGWDQISFADGSTDAY